MRTAVIYHTRARNDGWTVGATAGNAPRSSICPSTLSDTFWPHKNCANTFSRKGLEACPVRGDVGPAAELVGILGGKAARQQLPMGDEDEEVYHNHGGGVLMAKGFDTDEISSYEKLVAPLKRREAMKNLGGGGMTKCGALLCENSFRGLRRSPYISAKGKWYCSLKCAERVDRDEAKASLQREASATRWVPQAVSCYAKKRIAAVSAGQVHCALITTRGALYTWGYGGSGRLGHGDEEDRHRPARVRALRKHRVSCVAAGTHHTLVCTKKGGALSTKGLPAAPNPMSNPSGMMNMMKNWPRTELAGLLGEAHS